MGVEIKWIKLSTSMFDDEKIKLIRTMPEGDSITLIWVQMLCLAGRINDGGAVYLGQNLAYSDEMLATIFDHPLSTMRIALTTLEQFGLIEFDEKEKFKIANWEKHQSTDKMARIRHQNRERKRRYDLRNKLRELGHDPDAKEVPHEVDELRDYIEKIESNVTVTLGNATEVRSKKKEVRGKKEEVRREKKEQHHPVKNEKFDVDEDFKKVSNFYQDNLGPLSPFNAEDIQLWIEDLSADLVIEALERTVENQKRYSYAKGIMKNWVDNNIKTMDDVKAMDVSFNNHSGKAVQKERDYSSWKTQ